jgi:hypothetical protein
MTQNGRSPLYAGNGPPLAPKRGAATFRGLGGLASTACSAGSEVSAFAGSPAGAGTRAAERCGTLRKNSLEVLGSARRQAGKAANIAGGGLEAVASEFLTTIGCKSQWNPTASTRYTPTQLARTTSQVRSRLLEVRIRMATFPRLCLRGLLVIGRCGRSCGSKLDWIGSNMRHRRRR